MSDPKINVTIKTIRADKKGCVQIIRVGKEICIQQYKQTPSARYPGAHRNDFHNLDMTISEAKNMRDFLIEVLKGEQNGKL